MECRTILTAAICDIGEAAGPMIAGFLIGRLGYAVTFDVLAAVTAAVTVGLMALVRDPAAPRV